MKDLFDHLEELPQAILDLIDTIEETDYESCHTLRKQFEEHGYTFEVGLDGCPVELHKVGDTRKTVKIQSNKDKVAINCPHCDNWEETGVDDPRKNFSALPVDEWKETPQGANEESINHCTECKHSFIVEWDYSNPF